jgi:eukaryotic-like serine/threonine-protein kinase
LIGVADPPRSLNAMLTGRLPFEGDSLTELVMQIRQAAPERVRKFQREILGPFEAVILRMLEKRPEDRFQWAGKLSVELARVAG